MNLESLEHNLNILNKNSLVQPNGLYDELLIFVKDYKKLRDFVKSMEAESNNLNLDIGRLLRLTKD